jgi:DNA-binding transcriptional LysR family regulator
MSFGLQHVAPALPEFLAAYPEVSIDLQLDDRLVDLVAGGIDIALRIADLPDSSLIARQLCPVRRWVVGAPRYFARRGTPQHPRDLKSHACLGYSYLVSGETWRFKDASGVEETVTISARLSANNADALSASLEAGEGIALQPDFIAWKSVKEGRLVPVLTDWSAPPLALNLVTPAGGPRSIRTRVLLDFFTRRFSAGATPWTAISSGAS